MNRRRRRSKTLTIIILVLLVGGAVYINQVIVPQTPPLFMPTPTPTTSPESYLAEAEQFVAEGKYAQAIQNYKDALLLNPDNPGIFINIARLQIYTSRFDEALVNAGNALVSNPGNAQAMALRGYALGRTDDMVTAESVLQQAIDLDPNNPLPYAYMAEILALRSQTATGDLDMLNRAIEYSKKALSFEPKILEAHRARGIVYEYTNNYDEAVAEFEAAIALNSFIADLHIYLGRNYRAIGENTKAIQEFNNAISLNPTDPEPYARLSRTYASLGEYPNAISFGVDAIERDPTDPFLYGYLGVVYYRMTDYPKAIENLNIAVRGGTAATGEVVEGLALDYWPVSEFYTMLGLSLANQGRCGEALPIAQLVANGVSTEEFSVVNAEQIVNLCQQVADGDLQVFEPTETPPPE
ncbi:MAG: tetratricopeptide repeat protein [Bellilinea sp.]